MSGFVVYVEQGAVKHKQFVSEKARDCFVRDFLLENQYDSDCFIDFIGDGTISLAKEFYGKSKREQEKQEINVGDIVRVIKDEGIFLKAGEICKVINVEDTECIKRTLLKSTNPTYKTGIWRTSISNVELVNE